MSTDVLTILKLRVAGKDPEDAARLADITAPTGPVILAGDVTGASGTTTVERIRNRTIATTAPANGQVYVYRTASTSWVPEAPPSGGMTALTGDVTASGAGSVAATVARIQNRPVATTAPGTNQYLGWTGSQWQAMTIPAGGPVTLAGDVTGPSGATVVAQIRGRFISTGAPTTNQVLTWSGSSWYPATRTLGGDVTGSAPTTTVARIRGRQVATTTPQAAQALRWDTALSEWAPENVGEPTVMLDAPPEPHMLKFGQFGCEYKASPIRLWIGVPQSVANMEARLLIGPAPAPTIWDGGATVFDGGTTTWDVYA